MSTPRSRIRTSFSIGRRWLIGLNVAISCLAFLALVVMVNYLSYRHFRRIHWTPDQRFQLSRLTMRLLDSLTNQVKVIVFFDTDNGLYGDVKGLLKEYQLTCPRLDIEYVDYVRAPNSAALTKVQYGLSAATDKDLIIIDSNGSRKIVYAKELSDYDFSGLFSDQGAKRTAFKGERAITSAILAVTESRQFKAYYLTGHGEHDLNAEDSLGGYWLFAQLLQEKKISLQPLSLQTNDVPGDCQLLVIAGPQYTFSADELEKVDEYLNRGGRAFFLLTNPLASRMRIGLERLLLKWGVEEGDDLVLDRAEAKADQEKVLFISRFGQHDIVAPLVGARLGIITPHSIRQRSGASPAADTARVVELAFTSENGVARSRQARDEVKGAIPVMVAVEKGSIPGVSKDRGATRLVVVGDSYFLANGSIEFDANRDFANLAVNWLLDRAQLLDIGPRPVREYRLSMSESQMRNARWTLLGAVPGSVLMLGLLVWVRRRR
jgi:hypothetical protein